MALAGEILISEATYVAAGLESNHLERRLLELKGKTGYVTAYVLDLG